MSEAQHRKNEENQLSVNVFGFSAKAAGRFAIATALIMYISFLAFVGLRLVSG